MNEFSNKRPKAENRYFKLIEQVGARGSYQTIIIVLTCMIGFQNGITTLGTPYYFAVAPYTHCPPEFSGITLCTQFACSLPPQERSQFQQPQIKQLKTLGNQFGDYHCQKSHIIELAKGVYFFGGLVGSIVASIMSDNIGRRLTLLICLFIGCIGHVITISAPSLIVAEVGLFAVGFWAQSGFNVTFCILSQILQNSHRQKFQILIQAPFCIGGIFVSVAFYLFKSWKIIFILFCLIPLLIILCLTYFILIETPQYLIKIYQVQQIRQNLRFIACKNGTEEGFDENEILSEDNLLALKMDYYQQIAKLDKRIFTYLDLFRYKSLRVITIFSTLLFFCESFLYYAPVMLINQFGLDFYLNGVILNCSQLLVYIFAYFTILKIKRRILNIITSVISLLCSFLLIFLYSKQICTVNCSTPKVVLQMVVAFILRFAVSLQFAMIYIYITELYPVQVATLAIGFSSLIGHIPTTFLSALINFLNRINFPIMVLFCIIACVSIVASFPLEETYGRQPAEKIEELHLQSDGTGRELVEQQS